MKTGIFCNYENYYQDACRALHEQVKLVQHAESLGFEEAWVTEHHFNDFSVSSSILVLLAHLAGVTSTIRLGSAALLLPFHDPITVAEDIATLDNLCNGRFSFGIAKGGPFPEQNKHFATPITEVRAKTLEAMTLICKLLAESNVSFSGQYYHCDNLTISPKPLQLKLPIYVASGDDEGIRFAAEYSFNLMGGARSSLPKLQTALAKYRALNSSSCDNLMLVRFFFVAKTYDEAVNEALPFIRHFSAAMKGYSAKAMQSGDSKNFQLFDNKPISSDESYLLENSVVGDVATCRDKIKKFQDELSLGTLTLKPASFELQKNLESLTRYNQEVQTYL